MPCRSVKIDEQNKKLYCFSYGFGVVDIEKKLFEPLDKYIEKDKKKFIDEVEVKDNKIYYATNEGVKNTSEKKWYKARFVSPNDKIDIDIGESIDNILLLNDEIYLRTLGFKDSKLLKYNKENQTFDEVVNTFTKSPFGKYFTFKDRLYKMGYNTKFPYEIEDFESGSKYNIFFEDGMLFNYLGSSVDFYEYKDELYVDIYPLDSNNQSSQHNDSGLYKVSIEGEKFTLKKITPKGFSFTFYNDCVSFNDREGVYLYDLKTGELLTEYKEKNSLVILKLD